MNDAHQQFSNIERKRGKKKKKKTRERKKRERDEHGKVGRRTQSISCTPIRCSPSLLFLLGPMAAAADAPKGLDAGPTRP